MEAGAEMVKHQTHIVEDEMSAAAKKVVPGNARMWVSTRLCGAAHFPGGRGAGNEGICGKQGLIFISTPFSGLPPTAFINGRFLPIKIGSGECNNYPLIEHILLRLANRSSWASVWIPLPVLAKAVAILRKKQVPFALLHTTNLYPTPITSCGYMPWLNYSSNSRCCDRLKRPYVEQPRLFWRRSVGSIHTGTAFYWQAMAGAGYCLQYGYTGLQGNWSQVQGYWRNSGRA